MPDIETTPGNGVTRRELYDLIEKQNDKIDRKLAAIDGKLDELARLARDGNPVTKQRVDKLEDCQDELESRVESLETFAESIKPWFKLAAFVGSAIGLSVIALIWGILTHTIVIAIP